MLNFLPIRWFSTLAAALLSLAIPALAAQLPGNTQVSAEAGIQPITKLPTPDAKKAKRAYEKGQQAEQAGDWQAAFLNYSQAVDFAPDARAYRLHRELARGRLVQEYAERAERYAIAGQLNEARNELNTGLTLDPTDPVSRERLQQLGAAPVAHVRERPTRLSGQIRLQPQSGTRNFDYRGDTEGAYEEVARQFGVKVAFDVDLHPRQVRLRVSDVDFDTAMRVLGGITDTFWRPLNAQMFFVAQDEPAKRSEYDASVLRTILLPDSATPDQMTEVLRVVRDIAGITRSDLDAHSRTITIRDSPQNVEIASKLIEQLELPPSEVILEIEILEVNRSVARKLGITPPGTSRVVSLSQQDILEAQKSVQGLVDVLTRLFGPSSAFAGLGSAQIASLISAGQVSVSSLIPPLVAFGGGKSTFLATMPGAVADFSNALSLIQSGRRILLRAVDGQPATFFVGDRFPVSLGLFSASVGTASFIPGLIQTNFPRTDFPVGNGPVAVATGAFNTNHDKNRDIAAVNQTDGTVTILIGDGTGKFVAAPGSPITVGTLPSAIVTGKLNSTSATDLTDLAVANFNCTGTPLVCGPGTLSILLGNGDGTFTLTGTVTTGSGPVALVAGTFNTNNPSDRTDLAVVNRADNTVSILLGNGDGTFTPAPGAPFVTGNAPVAIVAGKFNSKNAADQTDLAVVNRTDNTVSIFLARGDGTFTAGSTLTTGNRPTSIATSDFNGDGIADLAVGNFTDDTVSIFLGHGDGTFTTRQDFATGTGPSGVATGDFNVDGRPDLAVADQTANGVSILIGLGGGTFAPHLDLPTGNGPVAVISDDLNADNLPDLLTANQPANSITQILDTTTFSGSNGLPQTPFPGSEYIDLGLKVKATARVHPDQDVTLKMEFELRSLSGQDVNGIPIISNRTIEQTVRLHVDETSALAGILQNQEMRAINGLPGLAGLGAMGYALGDRSKQEQENELLILITPRLLRTPDRKGKPIYAGTGSETKRASTSLERP